MSLLESITSRLQSLTGQELTDALAQRAIQRQIEDSTVSRADPVSPTATAANVSQSRGGPTPTA